MSIFHLHHHHLLLLPLLLLAFNPSSTQAQTFNNISQTCNSSVGIIYKLESITRSYPYVTDLTKQPYAFKATLDIFNAGEEDLKGWDIFINYVNGEILVDAGGALVSDGSSFPYNASNGVTLTSSGTLKTGIETANDLSQMGVSLSLLGTEFGKNQSSLPTNITLLDSNYECSNPITSIPGVCFYIHWSLFNKRTEFLTNQ